MHSRFFDFTSFSNRKSGQRRHHSRGRSLRGFENLEGREMMTAVPAFASLPGAPVTVYLDFDGHHEDAWGQTESTSDPDAQVWTDVNTPIFSRDADPNFSAAEVDMIHRIWQCVAEDFAPLNINVTTQLPSESQLAHTVRVAVGGGWDDWFHTASGGVSMPGSFIYSDYVNTVFAFSDEFSSARPIADVISQEVGHSFGLDHQRIWDTNTGEIIEEYNPGTFESAPLMGVPYKSLRSLWWKDPQSGNGWNVQDDMYLMDASSPLIDFRADDHGGTLATATTISNYSAPTKGIISANAQNTGMFEDRDAFIVTLPSASILRHWVTTVEVDAYSANLDAKLEVYKLAYTPGEKDPYGKTPPPPTLLGVIDSNDSLGAVFDLGGAGGTYMLIVRSHGDYGDLGQYSLNFYNQSINIANTDPITLPPLIDVICDPLRTAALPGRYVGQDIVISSRLNLALLAADETSDASGTAAPSSLSISADESPADFDTLDEAFAQFGKNTFDL